MYVLNAERAREEERLGLGKKTGAKGVGAIADSDDGGDLGAEAAGKPARGRKKAAKGQGKLF